MAKESKPLKEIRYINDNIVQGYAYFQSQAMNSQAVLSIVAEVDKDGTIELGLLGAFNENPLVLQTLHNELGKMLNDRVDSLIKVKHIEMID